MVFVNGFKRLDAVETIKCIMLTVGRGTKLLKLLCSFGGGPNGRNGQLGRGVSLDLHGGEAAAGSLTLNYWLEVV